jgi:hypothetical protein
MSDAASENVKSGRGFLKKRLAAILCAGLVGIALSSAGFAQTPGYGERPDKWASYESGRYFDHLQKIVSTYRFSDWKIAHLHFGANDAELGDVDLFRISRGPQCHKDDCCFVLFSSGMPEAPLITGCQFRWGQTAHFYNPDRSGFWAFEFECEDTLLRVKVTPTHFFPVSILKTQ